MFDRHDVCVSVPRARTLSGNLFFEAIKFPTQWRRERESFLCAPRKLFCFFFSGQSHHRDLSQQTNKINALEIEAGHWWPNCRFVFGRKAEEEQWSIESCWLKEISTLRYQFSTVERYRELNWHTMRLYHLCWWQIASTIFFLSKPNEWLEIRRNGVIDHDAFFDSTKPWTRRGRPR